MAIAPTAPERPRWSVVVPTVGRSTLGPLLDRLRAGGTGMAEIIVVDDRPVLERSVEAAVEPGTGGGAPVRWLASGGGGPAAARNVGWRAATSPWVVFLDDDVEVPEGWADAVSADLFAASPDVIGVQGRIVVPLPGDRPATDWERQVAGLADAQWITADMAYRKGVLCTVGGFDESFPRAFREDADLGMRASGHGQIIRGRRWANHPVRPAPWWISVTRQRGNADDVRMRAKHGSRWREACGAPPGRRPVHLVTTAALGAAAASMVAGHRRRATALATAWALLTGRFGWQRIAPGPRSAPEVAAMVATSVAIPPVATWWTLAGLAARARHPQRPDRRARAVLFDRDGTLVHDVAYNGDPERVVPVAGACRALARLRRAGLRLAIVSNQSGVGRGLITMEEVDACNERLQKLVGAVDLVACCPHVPEDGCACRKPEPGLVAEAAAAVGAPAGECVVVGDIEADLEAARRAGARAILVPNEATRPDEILRAPVVAADLAQATDMILAGLV